MALPAQLTRTTREAFEYRSRAEEHPHIVSWVRLRAITAYVEPAWAGAEVTVTLAFEGPEPPAGDGLPLSHGMTVEVFGDFAAARGLIERAMQRAPQALVGPVAGLLIALPEPGGSEDEREYRRKAKQYAFAGLARLRLGRLLLSRGRLLQADNALQPAARRAAADLEAWRWLGLARLLAGNADGAREALHRLIALGARDVDAIQMHALSLYGTREFRQASEAFGHVMRAGRDDAAARDLLACSLVQQWRTEEALTELDALGRRANEGWRLMAQKCRLCAQGHRAYRERLARDRIFRWGERWQLALARLAAAFGIMWWAAQLLWSKQRWVLLVLFPLVIIGLGLYEGKGAQRRAQDRLADAEGQVPNMPCWYVSIVRRGIRRFSSRRSIIETFERMMKAEEHPW